jgi:cell division septation protein DedD
MFKDQRAESEILLGNKQLLAVFFVLAILLGVSFTAGYMVGRSLGGKKVAERTVAGGAKSAIADSTLSGGETHNVDPASAPTESVKAPAPDSSSFAGGGESASISTSVRSREGEATDIGVKPRPTKRVIANGDSETEAPPVASTGRNIYLQVAALSRSDAEAVARVLVKKGFEARIAPKPGTQYYRVLVGPVKDAGDLNTTRDALKSKGFREVFVQHL